MVRRTLFLNQFVRRTPTVRPGSAKKRTRDLSVVRRTIAVPLIVSFCRTTWVRRAYFINPRTCFLLVLCTLDVRRTFNEHVLLNVRQPLSVRRTS
jgi:hypothetical protein